jgi:hypothetical protein
MIITMEPLPGFEPGTSALRKHCSTTELKWRKEFHEQKLIRLSRISDRRCLSNCCFYDLPVYSSVNFIKIFRLMKWSLGAEYRNRTGALSLGRTRTTIIRTPHERVYSIKDVIFAQRNALWANQNESCYYKDMNLAQTFHWSTIIRDKIFRTLFIVSITTFGLSLLERRPSFEHSAVPFWLGLSFSVVNIVFAMGSVRREPLLSYTFLTASILLHATLFFFFQYLQLIQFS